MPFRRSQMFRSSVSRRRIRRSTWCSWVVMAFGRVPWAFRRRATLSPCSILIRRIRGCPKVTSSFDFFWHSQVSRACASRVAKGVPKHTHAHHVKSTCSSKPSGPTVRSTNLNTKLQQCNKWTWNRAPCRIKHSKLVEVPIPILKVACRTLVSKHCAPCSLS